MDEGPKFTYDIPHENLEDSEWEYEYDEQDTESYYVTVDVSSASQQTKTPKKPTQSEDTDAVPPDEQQRQRTDNEETSPIDPALRHIDPSSTGDKQPSSLPIQPTDRIQILDLHTRNPLISYNNRIYSCTWGSTIGTDIFLTSPTSLAKISQHAQIMPLMTFPAVSVLGTSCIKLTARPVTITPKTDTARPHQKPPHPSETNNAQEPIATIPSDNTTDPPADAPAPSPSPQPPLPPTKIPINPYAPNSTRKQASFLESLMAIKAAKGEPDQVTVHATKSYQGYGWRTRRRLEEEEEAAAAEAMELEEEEGQEEEEADTANATAAHLGAADRSQPGAATADEQIEAGSNLLLDPSPAKRPRTRGRGAPRRIGRPRGSRGRVVKTGGLFRNLGFEGRDENQAGAGAADHRTPGRWEEIERRVLDEMERGGRGGDVKSGEVAGNGHVEMVEGGEGEGEGDVVMREGGVMVTESGN
ncbi:MAG: hypothetical protein Q9219_005491 [cf. Caloplaca sp. 3 TL-2023]